MSFRFPRPRLLTSEDPVASREYLAFAVNLMFAYLLVTQSFFRRRQAQEILLSENLSSGAALRELGWEADESETMIEYKPRVKKNPKPLSEFFTEANSEDMDVDGVHMEIEEDDGGPITSHIHHSRRG